MPLIKDIPPPKKCVGLEASFFRMDSPIHLDEYNGEWFLGRLRFWVLGLCNFGFILLDGTSRSRP